MIASGIFFSYVASELKYLAVGKEAAAIMEAVQKWKYYLSSNRFIQVTFDQKSFRIAFRKLGLKDFLYLNFKMTTRRKEKLQEFTDDC